MKPAAACPCGGPAYAACCQPYLDGSAMAPSAETLMRSRYTAYTLGREAYLRSTWHPSTCPSERIVNEDEKLQWLGLEVKSALRLRQRKVTRETGEAPDADRDSVEFVARYKLNGRAHRLHEVSRFVRVQGRWLYLDGSFPT
ncbi:MAG TPA: YchJ family metal-binding protein [Janthinobacterium sp.]|nr:YchJ family metal-binding protein [Janthinobacterium sp.]